MTPSRAPRLPVLMYHAVGTVLPARLADLSVPPSLLRDQLAVLREAGYRLVGQGEALAAPAGDRVVALTFDDGYADFADVVAGLLRDAAAGATLYVPSRHVGGRASWLPAPADRLALVTAAEIADLADAGIEIGSHGAAHVPLDVLPAARATAQVRESRDRLEQVCGRRVTSFCYPHGYADRRLARTVASSGFTDACVIGHGLHRRDGDPFRVRRMMVGPSTTPTDLLRLVEHGTPPLVPALKQVATPAWRIARRTALRTTGTTWT